MNKLRKERRKYERYETELKIHFHLKYDLKTKLSFKVIKGDPGRIKEYKGISRNVSVEGLGFNSPRELKKGDKLYVELYLPQQDKPICMTGEVRWSQKNKPGVSKKLPYATGVKILTLAARPVADTIYFDKKYGVYWSSVLNSVFGNFRKIIKKMKILNSR